MTKTCERAGIFEGQEELFKRMTCSRIRFSVITELVCLGEDSLDNIAYCFGKYSKEVCKKFYIQFYSTREAAKLSWKFHNMYNTEKEKKAVDLREEMLKNRSYPDVEEIEAWMNNRINILKLSGANIDPGLMDIVKRFRYELHFHTSSV